MRNLRLLIVTGLLGVCHAFSCTNSPSPLKVVYLGNSYLGGASVGTSSQGDSAIAWPTTIPSTNPGDVPSKVQLLADEACEYQLSYTQNLQSSAFLSTHNDDTKLGQVTTSLLAESHDAVVLQAQSAELYETSCVPDAHRVTSATSIFARSMSTNPSARKIFYQTWSKYDYSDANGATELCYFEGVKCTIQTMVDSVALALGSPLAVAPVGSAWKTIANDACSQANVCGTCAALDASAACGYDTGSCNEPWSTSGNGLFAVGDVSHQSEAFGAWLNAVVLYGALHSTPCSPPAGLLTRLGVMTAGEVTLLHSAAVTALEEEYGSPLPVCADNNSENNPGDCSSADDCNDNDDCTGDDCLAGSCVNTAIADCCTFDDDPRCDDGNPCTRDICLSIQCITIPCPPGLCERSNIADCCSSAAECEDGDVCTSNQCVGNSCTFTPLPTCCGDGVCEGAESCLGCPADCRQVTGITCGDGTCNAGSGETCETCPADCPGQLGGNPRDRFCCGLDDSLSPAGCGSASQCGSCTLDSSTVASCCGDGDCTSTESSDSCPSDCDVCAPAETNCQDSIDEDCDGDIDCQDADCSADSVCGGGGGGGGGGGCLSQGEKCNTGTCCNGCNKNKCT